MPSSSDDRPIRVLVVSRDETLPGALTALGTEVRATLPGPLHGWVVLSRGVDAVVLDIDDPQRAAEGVERLREIADMPVLVIPGVDPRWDGVVIHESHVRLLDLPLTAQSLAEAITEITRRPSLHRMARRLLGGSKMGQAASPRAVSVTATPPAPPPAPVPPTAKPAPGPNGSGDEKQTEPSTAAVAAPAVAPPTPAYVPPQPPSPSPVTPAQPAPARRRTQPKPAPPPPPTPPPTAQPLPPVAPAPARSREQPAAAPPVPAPPEPVEPDLQAALHVAHRLAELVELLPHLRTYSRHVVELIMERTGAEAAALLLPDGSVWRVAAGKGLRTLESRAQLSGDHWLIGEIARARHGILIEDTDIARQRLRGAPLAHWRQLLGAPAAEAEGILLLARSERPFTEDDLVDSVRVLSLVGPDLRAALDVRDVARLLEPFADRP